MRDDFPLREGASEGEVYENRTWLYRRSKKTPLMRRINRCDVEPPGGFVPSQHPPHSRPIGECVHWSAMLKWLGDGRSAPG